MEASLDPTPASQAQILRSFQRDESQIQRLSSLVQELIRSVIRSRWNIQKDILIDALTRLVYLLLTFGRGSQTLGEEYTDILPINRQQKTRFTRRRRFATIAFLLLPSFFRLAATKRTSSDTYPSNSSAWQDRLDRLCAALQSPAASALSDIHLALFMFGGRFLEFGRRFLGLSYLSMAGEKKMSSYEPLGILMLLPLMARLRSAMNDRADNQGETSLDLAPNGPTATSRQVSKEQEALTSTGLSLSEPEKPNTYLTQGAMKLPNRTCTLCLEPRGTSDTSQGTVAVTGCGHVFCWGCLGGLEKSECPLCRQALRRERLIPAYNL